MAWSSPVLLPWNDSLRTDVFVRCHISYCFRSIREQNKGKFMHNVEEHKLKLQIIWIFQSWTERLSPRPPEFCGDYDEFGERIKPAKPVPTVYVNNQTGMRLYRCVSDDAYDGFLEAWRLVQHQDIDRSICGFDWKQLIFACQHRHVEFARR